MTNEHFEKIYHVHERAKRLKEGYEQVIRPGFSYFLNFSLEEGVSENLKEGASELEIEGYATRLRVFTNNNSAVQFGKINNFVGQYCSDKQQTTLKKVKKEWNRILYQTDNYSFAEGIEIKPKGEQISTADIIDFWINGYIFHVDLENGKTNKVEEWKKGVGVNLTYFQFMVLLDKLSKLIIIVDNEIIVPLLNEYDKNQEYEK